LALLAGGAKAFVWSPGNVPTAIGLAVVAPVVVLMLLYRRWGAVRRVANSVTLELLTSLHVWRLVGLEFFIQYGEGRLPPGFALPAGSGDLLIGLPCEGQHDHVCP
jgi:hypothetical protein